MAEDEEIETVWMRPAMQVEDPWARGVLTAVLAMSTQVRAIGALAAYHAGAPVDQAQQAGEYAFQMFVIRATQILAESQIGEPDPSFWPAPEYHEEVDWEALEEDRKTPPGNA